MELILYIKKQVNLAILFTQITKKSKFITWIFFNYISFMCSSKPRLDRADKTAKVVDFDDDSKFILFSDCHRGDNSFADDFTNNRNIYFHALKHYYAEGFQYCELGDGDELWENLSFESILNAHKNVFMLMKLFHKDNRLHMIWGNHDMVYHSSKIRSIFN